ncbi:glycerate kinase [Maribacter aquivivus]|uniref:glycerate kinase n=1 Tax=Maribacter aquivivus TaxID=228958 RepID=UPI002493210D|nr:glycerate kinase [Maribacter aquivivus]
MKLLLIPDKFKGSLTSEGFTKAFISGVEKSGVSFTSHFIKASDGGDGFMNAVASYKPCIAMQVISENPLGKLIQSYYLYNQKTKSAYIELANTSGMELLNPEERNPMLTSTYGTGLQIKDAIEKGVEHIYLGLGGSATNDGGIGIAQALGYVFLNEEGEELSSIGSSLQLIHSIDDSAVSDNVKRANFYAVNDVTNPLFGENGASYVYARQKGATDVIIEDLDKGLRNLDAVVSKKYNVNNGELPGAGAAGGTAFGLKSFFDAEMLSGIDFILELSGVHKLLAREKFDYIITGEGRIDEQTLNGKLLQGILNLGKRYHLPVIAICGTLEISKEALLERGIFDVFEIQDESKDLDYNMKHAALLLATKTADYFNVK